MNGLCLQGRKSLLLPFSPCPPTQPQKRVKIQGIPLTPHCSRQLPPQGLSPGPSRGLPGAGGREPPPFLRAGLSAVWGDWISFIPHLLSFMKAVVFVMTSEPFSDTSPWINTSVRHPHDLTMTTVHHVRSLTEPGSQKCPYLLSLC